jgi:hypothetical protein
MAKQNINVGTTANDKKGDSLRAAFQKVNANFTELYTELGLVNDVTLSLGAFEFAGSTLSTTDSTAIVIDQAVTVSSHLSIGGDLTFPDATVQSTAFTTSPTLNILKIDDGVHEQFQLKVDATGVVTHDCSLGHIFRHTSPDANWTANFTNLNLSTTYATSITLIIAQGATGYYPSAVQIGGAAQTINWQGNVTPTVSTNRTDVVTFSIINNSGTYTVLGQLTGF